MIDSFVEIDGEEVHLQLTEENSHIMIVFGNVKEFDNWIKKITDKLKELQQG